MLVLIAGAIAGAIAIWRKDDDMAFSAVVGDLGQGDAIEIDPAIVKKTQQLEIPYYQSLSNVSHLLCDSIMEMCPTAKDARGPSITKKSSQSPPSSLLCCLLYLLQLLSSKNFPSGMPMET